MTPPKFYVLSLLFALSNPSNADVVKWVDEHGKTHFGDRAPEKYKNRSETIDTNGANIIKNENPPVPANSSYRPPTAETNSTQQDALRQTEEKKRNEYCRKTEAYYKKISTFNHHKGGYDVTVLTDKKTGQMMSRTQQDKQAEKIRKEANRRGCTIQQSKGLRLN